jgi:hypothetical protein
MSSHSREGDRRRSMSRSADRSSRTPLRAAAHQFGFPL